MSWEHLLLAHGWWVSPLSAINFSRKRGTFVPLVKFPAFPVCFVNCSSCTTCDKSYEVPRLSSRSVVVATFDSPGAEMDSHSLLCKARDQLHSRDACYI